jgi:fatty acid desaturase
LGIPAAENDLNDDERLRFTEISRWGAHVTTLSAGSIVIIATFAEKFEGRGPGVLLAIAAVGFALAIAAGLVSSLFIVLSIGDEQYPEVSFGALLVMGLAFIVALVSLAVFAAYAVT